MTETEDPKPTRNFSRGLAGTARDPRRMITIADWWVEFDEPIEHLPDPEATFRDDARRFISICLTRSIPFEVPEAGIVEAKFPLWFLRKQYPLNP
jgi:hypothetical protein